MLFGSCLFSQSQLTQAEPKPLRFEVASVKVHEGPPDGHLSISGPAITIRAWSMIGLLLYAYGVKQYQLANTALLGPTHYDVVAKAQDGQTPTVEEFKRMMRALLEDRFKLAVHREARMMDIYALVVAKNGPKFNPTAPDAKAEVHYASDGGARISELLSKVTMAELAERITNNAGLDRPVLDRTGLDRYYALKLTYTPEWRMAGRPSADPDILSVFAALQEQLGLKLEKNRAAIDMLVVDHVENPSEN